MPKIFHVALTLQFKIKIHKTPTTTQAKKLITR